MVGPGFGGPVPGGEASLGGVSELPREDEPHPDGPGYAASEAELALEHAGLTLEATAASAVPAFRRAVDAIDPDAALLAAHVAIEAIAAAHAALDLADQRVRELDPHAGAVSELAASGQAAAAAPIGPTDPDDLAAARALDGRRGAIAARLRSVEDHALRALGPQVFRGQAIRGGTELPLGAVEDPVGALQREASTAIDLLTTARYVRHLLGRDPAAAPDQARREAASAVEAWRGRPLDFRFLWHVLEAEGLLDALAGEEGESGRTLRQTRTAVEDQARATGDLGDVGTWDTDTAEALLSRGALDWAVSDDDAAKVFEMIASAAPAVRTRLVLQLGRMRKLDALCENLPWRSVQALRDAMDNPHAREALDRHLRGKGGGESLSKVYERRVLDNLAEGDRGQAFLWTMLQAGHNTFTAGFLGIHDAGYDAREEGWISDDAYASTTAKALGRTAAVMAATMATGGAAGGYAEGAALGLGAGRTTAQVLGGAAGGAASGVGGQLTADLYDQALLGKEGFSSEAEYTMAAVQGAAGGALLARIQALGNPTGRAQPDKSRLERSGDAMRKMYAERYPGLDNLLARFRNAGVRDGLLVRVTAQELRALAEVGLVTPENLQASRELIGRVAGNERIDVHSRTLSRLHPQSEIESRFGDVDAATGRVDVKNEHPVASGYVADAERIPAAATTDDQSMRDVLGVDGKADFYNKYKNDSDPLFEVRFRVNVELEVPLPQTEAIGTPLGSMHPMSDHLAGAGTTKGGVPEAVLPGSVPIEILDIRPVGTPRSSYPSTGNNAKWPQPPRETSSGRTPPAAFTLGGAAFEEENP